MSDTSREQDPRQLTLSDHREEEIRAAIEMLGPGELLVLAGEDPREIVDELEEEYPGRFEWSLLENRPERVRLQVRRRASAGPRSVTAYLERDHRRLDAIIPLVLRLADAGSFAEARARFGEFACGLGWHIDVEEQVLFPFFDAKTDVTRAPTTVMRGEHDVIRERIQRVTAALDVGDAAGWGDAIGELTTLISIHNMKEERMLYPMLDRSIDTLEAQERFVRRIALF